MPWVRGILPGATWAAGVARMDPSSRYDRRPLIDSAAFAMTQPSAVNYDDLNSAMSGAVAAIDNGEKTPQQAIQEIKARVDGILAQSR